MDMPPPTSKERGRTPVKSISPSDSRDNTLQNCPPNKRQCSRCHKFCKTTRDHVTASSNSESGESSSEEDSVRASRSYWVKGFHILSLPAWTLKAWGWSGFLSNLALAGLLWPKGTLKTPFVLIKPSQPLTTH